ncbi:MAG: hypothetical protein PHS44_02745 [Candidatus Dojkabacteria bacterium]|jgi:hypothetical protein|nr:hypothetical protein [Candidatus Dojkabacteria bacterium]
MEEYSRDHFSADFEKSDITGQVVVSGTFCYRYLVEGEFKLTVARGDAIELNSVCGSVSVFRDENGHPIRVFLSDQGAVLTPVSECRIEWFRYTQGLGEVSGGRLVLKEGRPFVPARRVFTASEGYLINDGKQTNFYGGEVLQLVMVPNYSGVVVETEDHTQWEIDESFLTAILGLEVWVRPQE